MTTISSILTGLADVAGYVYAPAVPFLSFAAKVEPYAEQALPVVEAWVKGGEPAAFDALKAQFPEYVGALTTLAAFIKFGQPLEQLTAEQLESVSPGDLATLAAHVNGIDPPGWAHADAVRWWARAQGDA